MLDAAHAITAVSSAAERTLGYPPGECVGLSALEFVHPDDRADAERWLDAVSATPARTRSYAPMEFRVRRRDGRWRMVEPTATSFVDASGVRRELVLARDVTDRRQLERQLQQAQKSEAIGNLAAGIAHDFNNVLTAIVGWSDALIQALPHSAPALSYAREIREASQHAADLATHLLAIRRDEQPQAGPLNLNDVVIRAAPLFRRLLGQRVECMLRLTPGVGLIRADATQMEQVLLNLSLNARDAMPDGGILTIETAVDHARRRRGRRLRGRRLRPAHRARHRHRHGCRHACPRLRAVLHDQGGGAGHRARPGDRERHRPPVLRRRGGRERAGAGHHVPRLPAAAGAAARRPGRAGSSPIRRSPAARSARSRSMTLGPVVDFPTPFRPPDSPFVLRRGWQDLLAVDG